MQPYNEFRSGERTDKVKEDPKIVGKDRNNRPNKRPRTILLITAISVVIIAAGAIGFLVYSKNQPSQQGCLSRGSFTSATSIPSASLPKPIESNISLAKGESLKLPPDVLPSNTWAIIVGDVAYTDPTTKSLIAVKGVYCPNPYDPKVGSLLAVQGPAVINATNAASYDLYPGNTTVAQIKQLLINYEQHLFSQGCENNKGCLAISAVIIDNGVLIKQKYRLQKHKGIYNRLKKRSLFREGRRVSNTNLAAFQL